MELLLHKQGYYYSSGTVIRRNISPKGDMYLNLFLKDFGLIWASAPGSARGRVRFGGGTEPLTWGKFSIYRGRDRFYLKSADVLDDMWHLRKDSKTLRAASRMFMYVRRNLPAHQPDDKLLAILYWNVRQLTQGCPPEVVEWRFLWRWLSYWGLAPDLKCCCGCGCSLESARWGKEGLLCLRCQPEKGGVLLEEKDLKDLAVAAIVSKTNFTELFCDVSIDKEEIWQEAKKRLLSILESAT